jgi:sRNA-binding carbon storage regulator CsrA
MLTLTRQEQEGFSITCPDGTRVLIYLTKVIPKNGGHHAARISIDAPREYAISRLELEGISDPRENIDKWRPGGL